MFVIDEHGDDPSARPATSLLRPRLNRSGPFVGSIRALPSSVRAASSANAASRKPSAGRLQLPSNLSIKKPCQYFYRSCKTADTPTARIREFGKAPVDVNAIPSKQLSPIGKLVFYALAAKSLGTNRTVWISDGAIALSCGVSRPAVICGTAPAIGSRLGREGGPAGQSGPGIPDLPSYVSGYARSRRDRGHHRDRGRRGDGTPFMRELSPALRASHAGRHLPRLQG
jgi:hypothetical protein